MRVPFTLTDNSTGTPVIYQFEVNPVRFRPPGRSPSITTQRTTSPTGPTIVMQGRDGASEGRMEGAVISAQQKSDLTLWFDKWYPLILTDDLNNTYEILWSGISWERLHRAINRHRYDYQADFIAL